MYQMRAWIMEDNNAVRYIREGFDTFQEVLDCIKEELKEIEVLEIHIFQRL